MVWRESPPLQEPSLTRSKNVVHVMGHGVGYNRPLNDIENGAGRDSIVANDRDANSVRSETDIEGPLDVNGRTNHQLTQTAIDMRATRRKRIPVRPGANDET